MRRWMGLAEQMLPEWLQDWYASSIGRPIYQELPHVANMLVYRARIINCERADDVPDVVQTLAADGNTEKLILWQPCKYSNVFDPDSASSQLSFYTGRNHQHNLRQRFHRASKLGRGLHADLRIWHIQIHAKGLLQLLVGSLDSNWVPILHPILLGWDYDGHQRKQNYWQL